MTIIRITSKLLGEWEGELDELLAANPDLDPELVASLAEGESIDFVSSERFKLTKVHGTGIIKVSHYIIRDLVKVDYDQWGPEGYSYTFEVLIKGGWVGFGPACFGNHTASADGQLNIGLGLMHLDKVYARKLGKELTT